MLSSEVNNVRQKDGDSLSSTNYLMPNPKGCKKDA